MKFLKMNQHKMALKKINKLYLKLISKPLNLATQKSKFGIVYTLYSNSLDLIEIGFAENDKILKNKVLRSDFILLDKKIGREQDLNFSSKLNSRYSNTLIRHLSTLGWPVGRSLYKQRKIKKELSLA